MQLSKSKILILGFILWPIIIAIPQFNLNYTPGLLTGKLNHGEIPVEFFLGLISGLFCALFFWGLGILVAKVINKVSRKESRGSIIYFYVTLFFFALMLITQGKNFYLSLTLDEIKVRETREMIKQYKDEQSNFTPPPKRDSKSNSWKRESWRNESWRNESWEDNSWGD